MIHGEARIQSKGGNLEDLQDAAMGRKVERTIRFSYREREMVYKRTIGEWEKQLCDATCQGAL